MKINDYKMNLDEQIVKNKLVSNLPNRPTLTANELKSYFDYIPITVLGLTKLNGLIDYLNTSGAVDIGVNIDGMISTTVQTAIQELLNAIITVKGEGWENQTVKGNAENILTIKGEGWTNENLKALANDIDTIKGEGWTNQTLVQLSSLIQIVKGEGWENQTIKDNADSIKTHRNSNDHDTRYPLLSTLGDSSGIATLGTDGKLFQSVDASKISSGVLPLSVIPDAVKERVVTVPSSIKLLALTKNEVQNGDTVIIEGDTQSDLPERWFRVIDDSLLGNISAFREIISGTTATAIVAKEYDINYSGGGSIKDKFESLEGEGRTSESIKSNAENITDLQLTKIDKIDFESKLSTKANRSVSVTATLLASGWTDGQQIVFMPSITATNNIEVGLSPTATLEQIEAAGEAMLMAISQAINSITVKAFGTVPTIDIPIQIIILG